MARMKYDEMLSEDSDPHTLTTFDLSLCYVDRIFAASPKWCRRLAKEG